MLIDEREGAYRVCEKCKTYVFYEGVILDFGDQDYDIETEGIVPVVCGSCGTVFTGDTESWIFMKDPEDLGYTQGETDDESGFTPDNIINWASR